MHTGLTTYITVLSCTIDPDWSRIFVWPADANKVNESFIGS